MTLSPTVSFAVATSSARRTHELGTLKTEFFLSNQSGISGRNFRPGNLNHTKCLPVIPVFFVLGFKVLDSMIPVLSASSTFSVLAPKEFNSLSSFLPAIAPPVSIGSAAVDAVASASSSEPEAGRTAASELPRRNVFESSASESKAKAWRVEAVALVVVVVGVTGVSGLGSTSAIATIGAATAERGAWSNELRSEEKLDSSV